MRPPPQKEGEGGAGDGRGQDLHADLVQLVPVFDGVQAFMRLADGHPRGRAGAGLTCRPSLAYGIGLARGLGRGRERLAVRIPDDVGEGGDG